MQQCDTCERDSLVEQLQAFSELIEVAKSVVSTLDLDTVLHAILVSAMHLAAMPAGSVALFDEEKQEMKLHAHQGLSAIFIKKERWEVTPGGLTERVMNGGEILFVEDTGRTTFFKDPVAVAEGIKSLICIPLRVPQGVVGVLYLDNFIPRQFDRERMKLLVILGSFAAMAIYNAKLHSRTKIMAITDGLTGLHNHRYFQEMFDLELGRAERYKKPLSLIMLDVDDFKKFNDAYGHACGDKILVTIGGIIARTLRRVDLAFRYGGEEFVVLLPEASPESALQVAERLRESIENETADSLRHTVPQGVTVSAGVVSFPDNGSSREDLFNTVDGLLYRAKEQGKNRVYFV